MIDLKKFARKPFHVEAVEVTKDNMEQAATWCQGQLRTEADKDGSGEQRYIKVRVKRPLNERQTKAYAGDYIVVANVKNVKGFKVYTPKAFGESFDEIAEHMAMVVGNMEKRAEEEDRYEQEELGFPEELQLESKKL